MFVCSTLYEQQLTVENKFVQYPQAPIIPGNLNSFLQIFQMSRVLSCYQWISWILLNISEGPDVPFVLSTPSHHFNSIDTRYKTIHWGQSPLFNWKTVPMSRGGSVWVRLGLLNYRSQHDAAKKWLVFSLVSPSPCLALSDYPPSRDEPTYRH